MKKIVACIFILLVSYSQFGMAATPTEVLTKAVDKLLAVASDNSIKDEAKKISLEKIIREEVNLNTVSKRVLSKSWKKATEQQKIEFSELFLKVMVDNYFALLKNYSNEKVVYLKEQIKKNKYAIVDTEIISDGKKIPVRYRMILANNIWKIYDFIPEGISLISTYKNNYVPLLKKEGVDGLITKMKSVKK